MCATTRRGHVVEDVPSCARCLYVNLDLRLFVLPENGDNGEEGTNGCDEDILTGLYEYKEYTTILHVLQGHAAALDVKSIAELRPESFFEHHHSEQSQALIEGCVRDLHVAFRFR